MFGRLFLRVSVIFIFSIAIALILLDDVYIEGLKIDELEFSKGINQAVFTDLMQYPDKEKRLLWWGEQFNYQFALNTFDKLKLPSAERQDLKTTGSLINVKTSWLVDDIQIYYYHEPCDCVLMMHKNYRPNTAWEIYMQAIIAIVLLFFALSIYCYAASHKKRIRQLVAVYQSYGQGNFEVRASTSMSPPYLVLAKTFNQMAERIEFLLQEQNILINGVSHDLKTPLARLRFVLDHSRSCRSVDDYHELIQEMDIDLDELDGLVNEWLFYAELTAKPIKPESQIVDFGEMIMATSTRLKLLYPDIKIDLSLQQQCFIEGEKRLLNRMVENLLSNALKFSNKSVHITLESKAEVTRLLVEDDGPGIKDELKDEVLRPFVKLDKSRNLSGAGLGLAIVKSILDKHQAQLTIKKSVLGGACFVVDFKKCK